MMKRISLLLGLLAPLGCDPVATVHGSVVDPSSAPVPNATATYECTGTTGTTDARGGFELKFVGFASPKCTVAVASDGYVTARERVDGHCTQGDREHCRRVELDVHLAKKEH